MPRPKGRELPYRISVSLNEEHYEALVNFASNNQATVSWIARRALIEFIEKYQNGYEQQRLFPLEGV